MHALGKLVQSLMDSYDPPWIAADVARKSGLSPQHMSQILDEEKTRLGKPTATSTIEALTRAFGGSESIRRRLWGAVAESMGLPAEAVRVSDPALMSNDELVRELAERLRRAGGAGEAGYEPPSPPSRLPTGPRKSGPSGVPTYPDPEDYDVKAAGISIEEAGRPEPEST